MAKGKSPPDVAIVATEKQGKRVATSERPPVRIIPRENILPIIQRMAALRELPNKFHREKTPIWRRACEEFGSWEHALAMAEVRLPEVCKKKKPQRPRGSPKKLSMSKRGDGNRKWFPNVVIAAIQKRHEEKQALLGMRVRETHFALYIVGYRLFGSWPKAIAAAGFDYNFISRTENPTRSGIPGVPISLVSFDAPITRDSTATRGDFIGENDPGFGRFEDHSFLQTLLEKRKLPTESADLLRRVLDGDDLEEGEYEQLAVIIRADSELLRLIETT